MATEFDMGPKGEVKSLIVWGRTVDGRSASR